MRNTFVVITCLVCSVRDLPVPPAAHTRAHSTRIASQARRGNRTQAQRHLATHPAHIALSHLSPTGHRSRRAPNLFRTSTSHGRPSRFDLLSQETRVEPGPVRVPHAAARETAAAASATSAAARPHRHAADAASDPRDAVWVEERVVPSSDRVVSRLHAAPAAGAGHAGEARRWAEAGGAPVQRAKAGRAVKIAPDEAGEGDRQPAGVAPPGPGVDGQGP
mmetsp:Transcript_28390/g.85863  ORF Transcript_28390/g.85863 Transcript_28390/m.85863 type:complete len:220 (+) Transcript_28390:34-693(+)